MKFAKLKGAAALLAMMAGFAASSAQAAIVITEVDAAGSATGTYNADWFELTNTGTTAVSLAGWKMDDNSNSFSAAVALRGVTALGAGQSAIFLESNASGSNDASINAAFIQAWFGTSAPAGLLVGNYGGSGVGLSQSADAFNIFNASGTLITRVDFGASSTEGFTFDNAAGLNNTTISTLSAVGVHGGFVSANGAEVGSPGTIAAVPEPATYALALVSLGLFGLTSLRRKR